jgi:ribosomal protein S27E
VIRLFVLVMSVDPNATTTDVSTTDSPRYGTSVSYMPCRECGEGSLVYDPELKATRCRCCGAMD